MPTAERFAPLVLQAAVRRRRELVLRPGTLGYWLKLLAPGLLDKIIISSFMRPAYKRVPREGA